MKTNQQPKTVRLIAFGLLIAFGFSGRVNAQQTEDVKLLPTGGANTFGGSVSIADETIFVGDGGADRAHVFERTNGVWNPVAVLEASDSGFNDRFGTAVSVSGNTAWVGDPEHEDINTGAAYVFERTNGVWSEVANFTGSGGRGEKFGGPVSICGDTAVVGALFSANDSGIGSAYVFEKINGVWRRTDRLFGSDVSAGDQFGIAAISGDVIVVGALRHDSAGEDAGAAYIFERIGGVWTETAKLLHSDPADFDQFGNSVSVSEGTVIVGSHAKADNGAAFSGAAYVFEKIDGFWVETAKLLASDSNDFLVFGSSVSVSNDILVVGARGFTDTRSAGYVFERGGGCWTETAILVQSDGESNQLFGIAASVTGNTAVIGAPFDNRGSAYVFTVGDPIDTDGDGLLDIWETNGLDINNDGLVDLDFPNMGADPLHKDLYLEVDLMDTVPFDAAAIQDVIDSFAVALVPNPDGTNGINLHIDLATADTIPFETTWDDSFVRFGEIKNGVGGNPGFFGTQEERDSVNVDAIIQAKKRTFRYATVVNAFAPKAALGWGETPGNDFMVAFSSLSGDRLVQGSTFMHEFGHNLNLQHGGGDAKHYKTNYVSVMNYGFDCWIDENGDSLPLDFSSEEIPPLDEAHIDETAGVFSVFYRNVFVFHGYDNAGTQDVQWIQLDGSTHDFNLDGNQDTDVSVDLNFVGPGYADGNVGIGTTTLTSFDDWQLILLPLGTTGPYANRAHIPPPFDEMTFEELTFMRENLPPPPINVATITDVNLNVGTILDGDSNSLTTSDQSYLHTRSGFGGSILDAYTTETIVSAMTEEPSPTNLSLLVESRLNKDGGTQTLSLKNWSNGQFDVIGSYERGTSEEVNFFKDIEATNYIGPNGEIELTIKEVIAFNPQAAQLAFTFDSFFDHVQITVK